MFGVRVLCADAPCSCDILLLPWSGSVSIKGSGDMASVDTEATVVRERFRTCLQRGRPDPNTVEIIESGLDDRA